MAADIFSNLSGVFEIDRILAHPDRERFDRHDRAALRDRAHKR